MIAAGARQPGTAFFDNSFHRGNPDLAQQFALPAELHDAGMRGMSDISNDIRTLLDGDDPGAVLAVEPHV